LSYAAALAVLGFTIKATRLAGSCHDNLGPTFTLWVITALMLSPLAWPNDLILLSIALVEMADGVSRGEMSRRALWTGVSSYVAIWIFYIGENVFQLPGDPSTKPGIDDWGRFLRH